MHGNTLLTGRRRRDCLCEYITLGHATLHYTLTRSTPVFRLDAIHMQSSNPDRSFLASDVHRWQTRKRQLSPLQSTSPSRGKRMRTLLNKPSLRVNCAVLSRPQPQFLRYSPLKQPIDPDLLLKGAPPLSAAFCQQSHVRQAQPSHRWGDHYTDYAGYQPAWTPRLSASSNFVGMCQTSASSGYSIRSSITAEWSHLQAPARVTETRARRSPGSGANRLYPDFVQAVVACLSRMKAALAEEQRRVNDALSEEQRAIKEILDTAALLLACGRSPDKGG